MYDLVMTRARRITKDVLYTAGVDDNADATEPLTRAYQYFHGKWEYREYPYATQQIALYHRPEGGRIAVYMSPKGELFSPEPSFRSGPIIDEGLRDSKKLGRLSDLRQVGRRLLACGDGGQTYKLGDDGAWTALDITLFDPVVDSNWAFAIRAPGNTGREQEAYWKLHPDEKAERNRRVRLFMTQVSLHSINGLNQSSLYICGGQASLYSWSGQASEKLAVPTDAYLLDILADDEDTVWVCGRGGTLLRGNAKAGFAAVPCAGGPNFSTITRFMGKIYLSSYANPRGLFTYDGNTIARVVTGLSPELDDVHTVDAVEGAVWVIGSRGIARFDGTAWERIPMPK